MTTDTYPALSQFLGGYFHQDWPELFSDPSAVVVAFHRSEPTEFVQAVLGELDLLIEESQQSTDPSKLLYELGCYFDPRADGQSVPEWLASVRTELATA